MRRFQLPDRPTAAFLICAVASAFLFLSFSNAIVRDLAKQERERMQIWADATKEIVNIGNLPEGTPTPDIEFLFSIIERNHSIPVLLTDDSGTILLHRNFDLPEPFDPMTPYNISEGNQRFLERKLKTLSTSPNVIHIVIAPGNLQHLYYEDSVLLTRLSYFPYIQVGVMVLFLGVVYYAVSSKQRAEQNKVWVGLSKETAHQLGTPISSLMAWMELLPGLGVDPEYVAEMDKDVKRLSTIASRFSKIGSAPTLELADAAKIVSRSVEYMSSRISGRIALSFNNPADKPLPVEANAPLFEWVMENLIKNAVDATDGEGKITITASELPASNTVRITVADTGKGIPRKNFEKIFQPGFTSKKRGWGLGLTLARRIINSYHRGKIYVLQSEPGRGTTFAIDLPTANRQQLPIL